MSSQPASGGRNQADLNTARNAVATMLRDLDPHDLEVESSTEEWKLPFISARKIWTAVFEAGLDPMEFSISRFMDLIDPCDLGSSSGLDDDGLDIVLDDCWSKVRVPEEYDGLSYPVALARRKPVPMCLTGDYATERAKTRAEFIGNVAYRLDKQNPGQELFLPTRRLAAEMGISHTAVAILIRQLADEGGLAPS